LISIFLKVFILSKILNAGLQKRHEVIFITYSYLHIQFN
jgi:hypothetical protein